MAKLIASWPFGEARLATEAGLAGCGRAPRADACATKLTGTIEIAKMAGKQEYQHFI